MYTTVPRRELKAQQKRVVALADTARANLAAHARSAGELRELGLMLGLMEVGSTGALVAACPWELDDGDVVAHGPDRCSYSSLN
ncbi:hypothetical protein [Streptomyces sp. NPDC056921]|uniref:hypothetical protein n=1 Tax=Streptomyces sp. NPDC056921 TaxID=3345966 RepID=UPI00363ED310